MEIGKDEKGCYVQDRHVKYYHADNAESLEHAKKRVEEMVSFSPVDSEIIKTPEEVSGYKHKLVVADESTPKPKKKRRRGKDEWLTPPELIKSLGSFDLDPCAPINRPWKTSSAHYNKNDDGLSKDWFGRVWLNPPYGRKQIETWLKKGADHGNTIALIFARTDTAWFFNQIWERADAVLFMKGRIRFYHVDGTRGGSPGCGSVLVAYGKNNISCLRSVEGKLIMLNE
jgi:phage N-6-adenine-methyltransferase